MTEFVHLHNHTDYSLLDGAGSAKKYVKRAKELGMTALGITDHGNMFGVMPFYFACKKEGIQPIIGCEFYVAPEGRLNKTKENKEYNHLVLLAMNERGYHNLMELNSIAYIEGFYSHPRIDHECLAEHSEGMICMSACLAGELSQYFLNGQDNTAYETAKWYKNLFGDRYYIELQNHFISEEITVLPKLVKLAQDLDIPLVATNDIHYTSKDDAVAHDILLCIGTKAKLEDEDRMRFTTQEFYMKTPDEMNELFSEYPQAISNTVAIAERCKFDITFPKGILPDVEVPSQYKTAADWIKALTAEGLKKRYPTYQKDVELTKILDERIEKELGTILKMGFEGYFLIVRDYIYWAKTHGIPVGPGRGSGAGSLVAYCIDITNVDPIKHDLLFERFLNPERVSLPDFDIDFSDEGRQLVIDYVTEKYGVPRVGKIATFGTLKPKQVVKDVARVLGIDFDTSTKITNLIPDSVEIEDDEEETKQVDVTLQLALDNTPELQEYRHMNETYELLFDAAFRLEGLVRQVGTHACGIVIGKTDLKDYVPLYLDKKTGSIATQYDKHYIEDCGLVKMDFLGLKTLSLLEKAEAIVKKTNPDFSVEGIGIDDAETIKMMAKGDSTMVFQFESAGMQQSLKKLGPTEFEDLNAMCSLYRPGPMDFIPDYMRGKHEPSSIEYPDSDLIELLKPTYGVIVYQEQVMRLAQIYAGFSLAQADELRRIMGKKQVEKLPAMREKFIQGAVSLGKDKTKAGALFDKLEPFGRYGFNKSHSVCYTYMSMKTAYLKCHYPAQFYAANLTNEIGNTKTFKKYLNYIKDEGYEILPPDVNSSSKFFDVVDGKIVFGLAGIKGVGEKTVELIISEREQNGSYKSFLDFLKRSDERSLNSMALTNLIAAGAFDCFGETRKTLMNNLTDAVRFARHEKEELQSMQNSLFGDMSAFFADSFKMIKEQEYPLLEKLDMEINSLGFYVSGHPLDHYRDSWKKYVRLDLSKPERIREKISYILIGLVREVKTITSQKNGMKMGKVLIEDYNGTIEITLFHEAWAKYEASMVVGKVLGFQGTFSEYKGVMGFSASIVFGDVTQIKDLKVSRIYIELIESDTSRNTVVNIRSIAQSNPGKTEIQFLIYKTADNYYSEEGDKLKPIRIAANTSFNVTVSEKMVSDILNCQGVINVYAD